MPGEVGITDAHRLGRRAGPKRYELPLRCVAKLGAISTVMVYMVYYVPMGGVVRNAKDQSSGGIDGKCDGRRYGVFGVCAIYLAS